MEPVLNSSEGLKTVWIPEASAVTRDTDSFFRFTRSSGIVAGTSQRGFDRDSFFRKMGIPPESRFELEQIHGANIVLVELPHNGNGRSPRNGVVTAGAMNLAPRADGAITRSEGIVLSVYTADCCALFFHDPTREAIGLAHVGWRGARARLAEKMVEAFRHNFRSKAENVQVGLGPHIRRCCYEVGEDLEMIFDGFTERRDGKRFLDLTQAIVSQLQAAGVKTESIEDSGDCTYCENHRYFSSRREGPRVGRSISVILKVPGHRPGTI